MTQAADRLAEFLRDAQYEWEGEQREKDKRFKAADYKFARYLGLKITTYSEIKDAKRVPNESTLGKIAAKLGEQAYILAGRPELVGRSRQDNQEGEDWRLRFIASHWDKLEREEQEKLIDLAKQLVDDKDESGSAEQIQLPLT